MVAAVFLWKSYQQFLINIKYVEKRFPLFYPQRKRRGVSKYAKIRQKRCPEREFREDFYQNVERKGLSTRGRKIMWIILTLREIKNGQKQALQGGKP